jgi:YHS domain-containing protein
MLRRLIVLAAIVGLILLVLRRLAAGVLRRAGGPGSTTGEPPRERRMVRDRMCNTFVPEVRALTARQGAQTHFFCSEACRRAFLERSSG